MISNTDPLGQDQPTDRLTARPSNAVAGPDEDAATVRAHIEYKVSVRELSPPVAARMLAALERGAAADYAGLLEAATFLPLPKRAYHTAPVSARTSIANEGLRASDPGAGTNWGSKATGQVTGVYVGAWPDERGIWSHAQEWDVWEIDTGALLAPGWQHDRLNAGCWVLLTAVPPELLRLHSSHGSPPDRP